MSYGVHLSVRVPWHDGGWNGTVCRDPLGNASCVLLKNVGERRRDSYEAAHASASLNDLDLSKIGCMTERGTFLSGRPYEITREHPYRYSRALNGKIQPTPVTVPAYGVHATPYFWLHRETVDEVLKDFDIPAFDDGLEELVDNALAYEAEWVLHGDNQKALIERFFADVDVHSSLVLFYAKHSPFDDRRTGGPLLVGAAAISDVQLPGRWRTNGATPFPSHMWETTVLHSLRPTGAGGILLPVAKLAELDAQGEDVGPALAWAPGAGREFAYVTERVSHDTAIATLERLFNAARKCVELGIDIPAESLRWLDARIGELWTMRGPAPGLGAVLGALTVPYPQVLARRIARHVREDTDPWDMVIDLIAHPGRYPRELADAFPETHRKVLRRLDLNTLAFLRLLTRFQLTQEQAERLNKGRGLGVCDDELSHEELIEDPYLAYMCTVGDVASVPFDVIDRGCYPRAAVRKRFPLDEPSRMTEAADGRRIRALLVSTLEEEVLAGNTVVPLQTMIERISDRPLTEACPISEEILHAHGLHPDDLSYTPEAEEWSPIVGVQLADGAPAFKLTRLEATRQQIEATVRAQLERPRHPLPSGPGDDLESILGDYQPQDSDDEQSEDWARAEKKKALDELYQSPFTVLNGRAGTGKTTLIRALVSRDEVREKGVLLLAPTGKARVQLHDKTKHEAQTIAQFLTKYEKYDPTTRMYLTAPTRLRPPRFGTVVVDESSMLTEDQLAALFDVLIPPDRLILVGDPRQLPPIGAGRPFVDLIAWLTSTGEQVPRFPRVKRAYAELIELRRQKGRTREDLMLATWFSGDEIPQGFEEVWETMRSGTESTTLKAIPWKDPRFSDVIDQALADELGVDDEHPNEFEISCGGRRNGSWVNFEKGRGGAAEHCEDWQILSPTRGHGWGTTQINRHLKRTHRQRALSNALKA